MNGVAAAVARNSRVSSRSLRVWTTMVRADPGRGQVRSQIVRTEPAADRGELVGQERVGRPGRIPEVLVGVDGRGHRPFRAVRRASARPRDEPLVRGARPTGPASIRSRIIAG